MVRHLRLFSLILFFLIEIVSINLKADDFELAQNFIAQNDCENALPILEATMKDPNVEIEKLRTALLSVSLCAEQTSDYELKKRAELLLIKKFPNDTNYQLKYIETLFYLSSYKDIIRFAQKKKKVQKTVEFWLSLGRTYFELNLHDKSIEALKKYLRVSKKNRAEANYWIGKNEIELEEYDSAIIYLRRALRDREAKPWVKTNSRNLLQSLIGKSAPYHARLKISYAYDNNILRDNSNLNDQVTSIDLSQDYYLIKKRKRQLGFGLDLSHQSYNVNYLYRNSSVGLRVDYSEVLTEKISNGLSLSLGKSQTNYKSDQNYLFSSYYLTYSLSKSIDLQPSLTFFANLNNSPVRQTSFTLSTYIYLDADYLWVSPYYRWSDSPQAVIDTSTGTPYVAENSMTTKYEQFGLILGFQKYISDKWNLTTQYSYTNTKYDEYNLKIYSPIFYTKPDGRVDQQSSFKLAIQYTQTPTVKWSLSESYVSNNSRGFQGFIYSGTPEPDYSYDQNNLSLSATIDLP